MRCIENLINGNIKEAKAGAKRHTFSSILIAAEMVHKMSMREALYTAKYLKGFIEWAQYCQEKHALTFAD
jgi:hypothetical protein